MPRDENLRALGVASRIFTPRQAIRQFDHFAGRGYQIRKIIGAVFQPGAHAIIYGERGVGKTSLANCIASVVGDAAAEQASTVVLPVVNCAEGDDFTAIWRRVFANVSVSREAEAFGFSGERVSRSQSLIDGSTSNLSPDDVLQAVSLLSDQTELTVILDEFDRVSDPSTLRQITDVMKGLSDQIGTVTLVMVGVGDSVTALIRGHESVSRHLVEVPMPRMSVEEQEEVIRMRLPLLDLEISKQALSYITTIARGLPYYVHLLGQKAAIEAITKAAGTIDRPEVVCAIESAIDDSEHSIKDAFYQATRSPQSRNKFVETLAACAIAPCDEFGYFAPKDLVEPYSRIVGKTESVSAFNKRLKQFTDDDRAEVLRVSGRPRSQRFRFRDPMLQPFVVLEAIRRNLIRFDDVAEGFSESNEQR